jgi:hypothetical protein
MAVLFVTTKNNAVIRLVWKIKKEDHDNENPDTLNTCKFKKWMTHLRRYRK